MASRDLCRASGLHLPISLRDGTPPGKPRQQHAATIARTSHLLHGLRHRLHDDSSGAHGADQSARRTFELFTGLRDDSHDAGCRHGRLLSAAWK